MSGSHGDLFREIGKLVLAAHAGQSIDLSAKSDELAERYANLGMPSELVAKMIARSLGAISVSMAIISNSEKHPGARHANGGNGHATADAVNGHELHDAAEAALASSVEGDGVLAETVPADSQAKAASALFPSGLRLSVLS
jgi:hypothetical protein